MSALTTCIQHCTGCANLCNKARKINKRHNDGKGRSKTVFADVTIVCVENPIKSTKRVLEQRMNLARAQDTRLILEIIYYIY